MYAHLAISSLLLGFTQKDLVRDLLLECIKMQNFEHPNVLKLSGVCLDGGPAPYIIMPFMERGSLLSYLREERSVLVVEPDSTTKENLVRLLGRFTHWQKCSSCRGSCSKEARTTLQRAYAITFIKKTTYNI